MTSEQQWAFPVEMRPKAENVSFDLAAALDAMVLIRAEIPEDAMTAEVLGTERIGYGVFFDEGLILTIGYLITEAQSIWLTLNNGTVAQGYPMAYDQATGFGIVKALGPAHATPLMFGEPTDLMPGERAYLLGHGGLEHALEVELVDRREFAGYWEYLLDQAMFTAPAHPKWGGAGLLNQHGELIGIGSLMVQEASDDETVQGNMIVPIDILTPILESLLATGQSGKPARPWLGLYANEAENNLIVAGTASHGPADKADLQRGDVLIKVGETRVQTLAGFLRAVWSQGPAGTAIPLTVSRQGDVLRVQVDSVDRNALLKGPQLH